MGSRDIRLACLSGSNRTNFPKGLGLGIACALAGSGTISVGCRTAASGPAIIGLAGRDCFGLSNIPNSRVLSRSVVVTTSACIPISRALVPANALSPMRKAPVSLHATITMNTRVSSLFSRLMENGNCSRG